jgi:hypothetical protein
MSTTYALQNHAISWCVRTVWLRIVTSAWVSVDQTKHTEAMRHEQGNSRIALKGGSVCNRLVQIFGTVSVVTIFCARGADEVFPSAGLLRGVFWRVVTGVLGATSRWLPAFWGQHARPSSGVKHSQVSSVLMFIGPCIFMYSYSTTNEMHLLSQIIYSCKTLYMFRTVFPSIIRSSKRHLQQRYMSNSCCYLLQSGMRRNCSSISSPIGAGSSSCLTYTVAVDAVLSSWWWTKRPSETCRAFYKN